MPAVYLYCYKMFQKCLTCCYHTSIVVDGVEYSYGNTGIIISLRTNAPYKADRIVELGTTDKLIKSINEHIETVLSIEFTQDSYCILTNNCRCFAAKLCKFLCDRDLPIWLALPKKYVRTASTARPEDEPPKKPTSIETCKII